MAAILRWSSDGSATELHLLRDPTGSRYPSNRFAILWVDQVLVAVTQADQPLGRTGFSEHSPFRVGVAQRTSKLLPPASVKLVLD